MPSFVEPDGPDQQFLLPPDAREWLPAGHLAWQLLSVTGELDVSEFVALYRADGKSRPAYHPQAMLGLVMYCYCKGIRSSRAIEMACYDDLGARVIMGQRQPDHATVARFVTRHGEAIKRLLVQTLTIAARDGLLKVDVVAGDGTVVKANASMASNVTAEQLDVDIEQLQAKLDAEVESWFEQAAAADAADDALFDDEDDAHSSDDNAGPPAGPGSLRGLTMRLLGRHDARRRQQERADQRAERDERTAKAAASVKRSEFAVATARAAYQAKVDDWHARNATTTRGLPGTRPVPVDEHRSVRDANQSLAKAKARHERAAAAGRVLEKVNTTDPGSRIMPGKRGGYLQGYNVQIHAAKGCQIVLHIATHDNPSDAQALHPGLQAARANLDAAGITTPITAALFDSGYASDANFTTACPDDKTQLLVAVAGEARQTGRRDNTGARHQLPSWQDMATRLATDNGKALYKQRSGIIEPVFAQFFARLGRHLNYRGPGVDTELHLAASSHNLLKIIRHRTAPAT